MAATTTRTRKTAAKSDEAKIEAVKEDTPKQQEPPKQPEPVKANETINVIEVNDRLATINIKGKEYVPVNQRVLGFRSLWPIGKIITEIIRDDGESCLIKASIYDDRSHLLATGHAAEDKKSGKINATSYIENCETSAVGRALGLLGIGIKESIASADEVQNVINNQPEPEKDKPIPATGTFTGKCRSCGKAYTFPEGTTMETLRSTPCCDRPDWVVA